MDTFSRNGLVFDVTDRGPADGPVVILLHGFPQDRSAWEQVTPLLHDAGLRTLAPDQRGYSPRATPRGRAAYVVPELVGDVAALIDASGASQVHLVGHDWGGGVAWAARTALADRLSGVTVISTPHTAAMLKSKSQWPHSAYMLGFQVPWVAERAVARTLWKLYRSGGVSREVAAHYVERFGDPSSLTGPLSWYRAMPLEFRGLSRGGGGRRKQQVPTTYLWGSRDPFLGREAAERTAEFVSGDYEFRQVDAHHWLPETNPKDVADAILRLASPSS